MQTYSDGAGLYHSGEFLPKCGTVEGKHSREANTHRRQEPREAFSAAGNPNGCRPASKGRAETGAKKLLIFFITHQCYSCHRIATLTRQAVETGFKDQIAAGRVEFKGPNIEESPNEHFVQDYKLCS